MNDSLRGESERLRASWDKHPREHLDQYLVSDVEDPRINFQSILTRGLIADALFPGEFPELIEAEWRFGLVLTWLVQRLQEGHDRWRLLDALDCGDGSVLPEFVLATHRALQDTACPIQNYVTEALAQVPQPGGGLLAEPVLDTFASIWNRTLAALPRKPLRVIEPACGSANDYRCLARHGFAPLLEYSGFDISPKNVANAQARFPNVNLFVGNAFEIPSDDGAFEYLFVHDLFEHLSPEGLETAIGECLRVTAKEAWLSFFNLAVIPDHEFHAVEDYYCNTLSLERMRKPILRRARSVQVIDVPALAKAKFGCADYHNPDARTLIVEK